MKSKLLLSIAVWTLEFEKFTYPNISKTKRRRDMVRPTAERE